MVCLITTATVYSISMITAYFISIKTVYLILIITVYISDYYGLINFYLLSLMFTFSTVQ